LVIHRLPKNCSVVSKLIASAKFQVWKTDVRHRLHVKILIHLIIAVSETIKQCKIHASFIHLLSVTWIMLFVQK